MEQINQITSDSPSLSSNEGKRVYRPEETSFKILTEDNTDSNASTPQQPSTFKRIFISPKIPVQVIEISSDFDTYA